MAIRPEILVQNTDVIRVDSTCVNGTPIWNLANASASEHGACFCSFDSAETRGLGLASLPSLPPSFWDQWGCHRAAVCGCLMNPALSLTSKPWPFLIPHC